LARIVIERRDPQDQVRLDGKLGDQMRSTYRAELAKLARRRLERGQFVLSGQPSKMSPISSSRGRKPGRVRFAAGPAGTVIDRPGEIVDLVADGTTKATAVHVGILQQRQKGKERAATVLSSRSNERRDVGFALHLQSLCHPEPIGERPVLAHLPLALQLPDR